MRSLTIPEINQFHHSEFRALFAGKQRYKVACIIEVLYHNIPISHLSIHYIPLFQKMFAF